MRKTREVTLRLRLPIHLANQVEVVHRDDPEFLERIILYGLTRRLVLKQILERDTEALET